MTATMAASATLTFDRIQNTKPAMRIAMSHGSSARPSKKS